jgi:glycosyltransferase involved in cell wall biosynthesis
VNSPSLSVAIPALNEEQAIGRLLDDLATLPDGLVRRTVVIDGGSRDRTREVVDSRGVAVLDNPLRHAAGARQIALDSLQTEYVCFLDADCRLLSGWENAVVAGLDRGFDGFGGPVRSVDRDSTVSAYCSEVFSRVMAFDDEERIVTSTSVGGSIVGGNCVLRRKTALRVGGFDTSIGNYGEDLDLLWRIIRIGATVVYLPDMQVGHHFPETRYQLLQTWYKYGRASSALTARHLPTPAVDPGLWSAALATGLRSLRPGAVRERLAFLQLTAHLAGKITGSLAERVINL